MSQGIFKQLKNLLEIDNREDLVKIGNEVENDFCVELSDGREYRFIHTDLIEGIFHDECKQLIQDCYELDKVPDFIEIDWQATTDNCLVDGYGHQFSSYDGNEIEIAVNRQVTWHVFRTN